MYIKSYLLIIIINSSFSLLFLTAAAVRQHILMDVKKKYKTIEEAEDALDLTLESYLEESEADMRATPSPQALNVSQSLLDKLTFMTPSQLKALVKESCQLLSKLPTSESNALEEVLNIFMQLEWVRTHVSQSILSWFEISRVVESVTMLNKCFDIVAKRMDIQTNVLNFPSLSLESMKKLQSIGKSNTVYNLSKVISEQRPDGSGTLMPLQRMPFGMVHYIIDFFASTNVMQVHETDIIVHKWGKVLFLTVL